jgi:hypothetical protein
MYSVFVDFIDGAKLEYLFLEEKPAKGLMENLRKAMEQNLKSFRFCHTKGDTTLLLKDIRAISIGGG